MGFIIIGIVAGTIFGAIFFDSQGMQFGTIMGGLAGLVLQQLKKIGSLEQAIENLKEEQANITHQLYSLKNDFQRKSSADVKKENVIPAAHAIETPPVITVPISSSPSINLDSESFELELPDIESSKTHTFSNPIKPIAPREPNAIDKLLAAVKRFFTEGNPIVRIGMVIMFFGVSFLVKYASTQGLLPIDYRLTGILLGAIALLVVGWKTRLRAGAYGLVLQGGGIAVIYLTLFAAAKMYGLIPLGIAFGLLFLVVMLGVLLALLQNTQVLAVLATAGGFLAPILTSTGEGSHVGLFSFYLILNLGILTIAVYKTWRLLNWVGFMFTFVITATWGVLKYEPIFYASTQPFLLAFFALYLTVSILFSFKQPTNLKGMVDGSLVFGLPLVAFGLQAKLLQHTQYGVAISAVALAAIYLLLSGILSRRHLLTHRVLIESFLALGVSFATLAVPLALDASWTSVTWALEATGLVWVGLRQERLRPRCVGYLLHVAAAVSLFVGDLHTGLRPILDGDFLCLLLLALTSFTIAYLLQFFQRCTRNAEKVILLIAIALGLIWWFTAGINEIHAHVSAQYLLASLVLFSAFSGLALLWMSNKLQWPALAKSGYSLLPLIIVLFVVIFVLDGNNSHPAQGFNWLSILLFFTIQYRFLFIQERTPEASIKLIGLWHIGTAWCLFGLIFWEAFWQQENHNIYGTGGLMIWFAAITIPAVLLMGAGQKKYWPFIRFESHYKNWIPAPLFLLAGCWFFSVCHKTTGDSEQYFPVLNPLDLGQFAVILIFAYAAKHQFMNRINFISHNVCAGFLGVMLFIWVNIVTLRAMGHYQDIPYNFYSLWNSAQVQMALSILWTLCALLVMNLSRRIQRRELWMIGAGLLGLVVLKLFTEDLTGSGTLARIISFLVVGGLMLLIGFLSPIPSKPKAQTEPDEEKLKQEEQAGE